MISNRFTAILAGAIIVSLLVNGCAPVQTAGNNSAEKGNTIVNKPRIESTASGWRIDNGGICIELARTDSGGVNLVSLANGAGGHEWALKGSPTGCSITREPGTGSVLQSDAGFRFIRDNIVKLPNGGVRLELSFADESQETILCLLLTCYPDRAVIEYSARLENHGKSALRPICGIRPLRLSLGATGAGLQALTAAPRGGHGFVKVGDFSQKRSFDNWVVCENTQAGQSLLVGGDLGVGILRFEAVTEPVDGGLSLCVGTDFPGSPNPDRYSAIEVGPGQSTETPIAFLAVASGGPDEVANEAFRYLRRYVFPKPVPNSPLATYCIWLTEPNSEERILEELEFARKMGFDVFYHDASWYEGSSLVPGVNDWSKGLGSYKENRDKFPHGLAYLSKRVRASGMKFGLWVDPGMVDMERVTSGEIPESWLAKAGGNRLECWHPSLTPMAQLCLGNPEVVEWLEKELDRIIDTYDVEWMKWDPSGTASDFCDREDHGHGKHGGAWASYQNMVKIWSHLLKKHPNLSGFECSASLHLSRTNPGPMTLLPGGYVNEFITGPMVAPFVWGSMAIARGDADEVPALQDDWYSASSLDYNLRRHFIHGVTFGNVNGASAQLLSNAPAGYIEAYHRALLAFKKYRHLLLGDVWHPELADPANWSAIQYTSDDAGESVLFVFRNEGGAPGNTVRLKALDPQKTYVLTSLNETGGRERSIAGDVLMRDGIGVSLPHEWLGRGAGLPDKRYENQLGYGSDIILIRSQKK